MVIAQLSLSSRHVPGYAASGALGAPASPPKAARIEILRPTEREEAVTFHSRSVVTFGKLLADLTVSLTDGSPIPAALRVVREHFGATAAVLRLSHFGRGSTFFADQDEASARLSGDPASLVATLADSCHQVAAKEPGTDKATEYAVWIFREMAGSPFDQEEMELANVLAAQIARSLDLASRLDNSTTERALYSDALERLNIGVVMIDVTGKVASASPVARRFLASRNGLQIQAGKLRAVSAGEDRDLQAAIRGVSESGAGQAASSCRGLAFTKNSGARTLGVMIRPAAGLTPGLVAVYIRDCETAPELQSEFVRQIFDLTPAEAAVTHRLTAGLSLEDAANSLAISRNTARAHLRSIFSKSGITRQTELVRLVLNSAVLLGECPEHAV